MRPRKRARVSDKNRRWGERVPEAPEYNFTELVRFNSSLRKYITLEKNGRATVDFTSRDATLAITKATMKLFFSLELNLPSNQLIPRIPSRVQYLRWAASLLPESAQIRRHTVLDIGTGPSAIYPLLGVRLFPAWKFIGTDIDDKACSMARVTVRSNRLGDCIRIKRTQCEAPLLHPEIWANSDGEDTFDTPSIVVCNPPFFDISDIPASAAGTESQTQTEGGEVEFVRRIAKESVNMPGIRIFTSLIGRGVDVHRVKQVLKSEEVRAKEIVDVKLSNGTARSRWAVAWKFGPTKSTARVSSKKKRIQCEYEGLVRVTPSRFHKNNTTPSHVLDAWCGVMRELGWELASESVDEHQAKPGSGDIGPIPDPNNQTDTPNEDAMEVDANTNDANKIVLDDRSGNVDVTRSETTPVNQVGEQQVLDSNTNAEEQAHAAINADESQEQAAEMNVSTVNPEDQTVAARNVNMEVQAATVAIVNGEVQTAVATNENDEQEQVAEINDDGDRGVGADVGVAEQETRKENRVMTKSVEDRRTCHIKAVVGEPSMDGSFFLEMTVKQTGGTRIFFCYDLAQEVCVNLGDWLDRCLDYSP